MSVSCALLGSVNQPSQRFYSTICVGTACLAFRFLHTKLATVLLCTDNHGNAYPTIAPGYVTAWARKYLLTGAIGLYWLYKCSALGRYAPSCLSLINPIHTSAPVSNYYISTGCEGA